MAEDDRLPAPVVLDTHPVTVPRPGDRRQRRQWVPFDMRSPHERRQRVRRRYDSAGRRENPQSPLGIDDWA